MSALDPQVSSLLASLSRGSKEPPGAAGLIQQVIAESPYLSRLLAQAAADGRVGAIAISHGENSDGHFQDKDGEPGTLFVSVDLLQRNKGTEQLDRLTEVLGHEAMHGVLGPHRTQALEHFVDSYQSALTDAHQAREQVVDLTGAVKDYLDRSRQDEALSEISGLRALNSRLINQMPTASPEHLEAELILRSSSRCIESADNIPGSQRTFAPGLSYESLTAHPYQNGEPVTKAVAACYSDAAGRLGRHGDSDYRNYYGVYPIARIAQDHAYLAEGRRPPDVRIDLKSLGLTPAQLERNGLDLGRLDTFAVTDLGKDGYGWLQLKNTGSPYAEQASPAERASPSGELSRTDQTLLDQIRTRVGDLDTANGRAFDDVSERMSASLLVAARAGGLERVDHVLLSQRTDTLPAAHNIFVVQGDPADPTSPRAHVATAEAAQRPLQDSLTQVTALGQRQAMEQAADQQRGQEQQQRASMSL